MSDRKVYTNTRGNKSFERPYTDLSMDERWEILEDYIDLGIKATCKKWNIKDLTLHQLKYFYRVTILEEIENKRFEAAGL